VGQSVSWRISSPRERQAALSLGKSVSGDERAGGGVLQGLQGYFFRGPRPDWPRRGAGWIGRVHRRQRRQARKQADAVGKVWDAWGCFGKLCEAWGRFGKGPRRQCRFPSWQGHWPMRTFPTTGRRSQVGPGLRWFPSVSAHAAFQRCHPVLTAVKSMWLVRGFRIFRPYRAGDVFPGVV
jgi:hypothetical protein